MNKYYGNPLEHILEKFATMLMETGEDMNKRQDEDYPFTQCGWYTLLYASKEGELTNIAPGPEAPIVAISHLMGQQVP
eukprot:11220735-Lingulodinium_polyedra.AAC.1